MLIALHAPAHAQRLEDAPADEALGEHADAQAHITAAELDAALARYRFEPSVDAVVAAALAAAPRVDVSGTMSRARASGWVPRLALRARRGQTLDLANPQDDETLRVRSNDDLTLEASLVFELDRVVFRSEEVGLLRQQKAELEARAALVRQVIHLYYERRRLQVERDLAHEPKVARSVRIAEATALLDAFTGGAFQRMIEKGRWKTGARANERWSRSPPKSRSTGTP